jgi:hypothetical protein
MTLVHRVKKILIQPKDEWEVIATETDTTAGLYRGYIAPLAAIGPISAFIGMSLVGISLPFVGTYRVPIFSGIGTALITYGFALAGIYIIALIVNALSPSFGGQRDQTQALKVVAYASTPGWVAGILQVLPVLGILALLASLYGIYLLYLGLPRLMKSAPERAGGYTATVVLCIIALSLLIGFVGSLGQHAPVGQLGSPESSQSAAPGGPAAASQLEGLSQRLDAASNTMEASHKPGNACAQGETRPT